MKIAVYTIALNEEQFVERWANSAKEADYLLIADTGSTDNTVELAKKHGVNVISISIKPWRFDDARNSALSFIPDDIDYCISLDMDEVLLPGWRQELEKTTATRPRYTYTWSWQDVEETIPGLQYGGDKIHARHGYRWKHPVHEVLVTDRIEEEQEWLGLEIHHHPDHSKSRGQYLSLLEQAVKEDPNDDRNAFYYAREVFYTGNRVAAAEEFRRHLSLPNAKWAAERAASMRFLAKCEPWAAKEWLEQAVAQDPNRRESRVELSLCGQFLEDWQLCYDQAKAALAIKEKPLDYLCEDFAWGSIPWDLAAVSAYNLGNKEEAIQFGENALELSPNDERLARNLEFYRAN